MLISESFHSYSAHFRSSDMDHIYFDEYDYFNFGSGYDKIIAGKQGHSKHKDPDYYKYAPSGHVRKMVTKLQNAEKKKKVENLRHCSF